MHPVYTLNGPIGVEELGVQMFFAHNATARTLPALPGQRQASPKSSASTLNMHALDAHLTS